MLISASPEAIAFRISMTGEPSRLTYRQRERERRAATDLALDPQPAAVELDEAPRQRQPESGALALARVVGPDLTELLEDRVVVVGRDANAGVADGDLDRPVGEMGGDADASALGGELDRVREQVDQHLLDLTFVADDLTHTGIDSEIHAEAVARGALADERKGVLERERHAEVRQLEVHAAGFDLGQIEDVVDQREEVPARRDDVLQVFFLLRIEVAEHPLE